MNDVELDEIQLPVDNNAVVMDVELDEVQLIVNNISKLTINSIRGGGGGVMTSAIADGGSNSILFPRGYPGTTNFKPIPMSACLADGNSQLQIYGTAMYGIFQVMIADVQQPIWSECSLVFPPIQFSIFKQNRDMC